MKIIPFILLIVFPFFSFSQDSLDSIITSKYNPEEFGDVIKDSSVTIRISGLGDFDSTNLYDVSKKIESYFGFKTFFVDKNFDITGYLVKDTKMLDANLFLNSFKNDTVTIYVTNSILYYDKYVAGAAASENLSILLDGKYYDLKDNVIHELGHIFGLGHCENENCIMSSGGSSIQIDKFCNKCLEKMYR